MLFMGNGNLCSFWNELCFLYIFSLLDTNIIQCLSLVADCQWELPYGVCTSYSVEPRGYYLSSWDSWNLFHCFPDFYGEDVTTNRVGSCILFSLLLSLSLVSGNRFQFQFPGQPAFPTQPVITPQVFPNQSAFPPFPGCPPQPGFPCQPGFPPVSIRPDKCLADMQRGWIT